MMRTANPALNEKTFRSFSDLSSTTGTMTIQGTVNKTFLLLLMLVFSASWTWSKFFTIGPAAVMPWMIGGAIIGFITALITIFKRDLVHITAPIYAVAQGLFLGGLSSILESQYPGIVIQAVGLTFGTLFCLLAAYKSGVIKVTENFKLGIVAATGGIALFYFISFILGMFGVRFNAFFGSGFIGIGFSLFVVVIAALNLVLDFDFIESGANQGAPKKMEWYGAFGLLVTLVWLYVEILRLLSKLRNRR
jgi:uncharacterized YccA/Bax inhibitor family protein